MTTALCLYRVVQEALRNIAKHADARQVDVTVRRVEDEVQIAVADDGKGFDLAKAREQAAVSACAASRSGFGWSAGGSRSKRRRTRDDHHGLG